MNFILECDRTVTPEVKVSVKRYTSLGGMEGIHIFYDDILVISLINGSMYVEPFFEYEADSLKNKGVKVYANGNSATTPNYYLYGKESR